MDAAALASEEKAPSRNCRRSARSGHGGFNATSDMGQTEKNSA